MKVMDILAPECIRSPLTATDKRGAIDELVDLLAAHGHVSDAASLKQAVWDREQKCSTGIGHGFAIPHGKCGGVETIALAIGRPAVPLDFEAIDGKPVRLIALLASPTDRNTQHIHALARVSKLMFDDEFRARIYPVESGEELYEMLRERDGAI